MAAAGADLRSHREEPTGARPRAGTGVTAASGRGPGGREAPIGRAAFLAVAVASFGGPLALAALGAPGVLGDGAPSAGLAALGGTALFLVPLAVWLGFARHVNGGGGLYTFVEAAAGRRLALVQAAVWVFSYGLYLVYTTVQIVYDTLPVVWPAERAYQTPLALLIPVALAATMVAGRGATIAVIAVIAAGQVALAGVLDVVTLDHLSAPGSSFGAGAPAGPLAGAGAQTSLLYVCGSLPLFLGGELSDPGWTIRRLLPAAYGLTGLIVVAAVAPLAAAPGLAHTDLPGFRVIQQHGGEVLARTVGIGVAVSITGVMLVEYLALSRLAHAVTGWPIRRLTRWIGAGLVVTAPLLLIDPEGLYSTLLKPSLVALWLSQLIVFAVYPRFARRQRMRAWPAGVLGLGGSALALYGMYAALAQSSS